MSLGFIIRFSFRIQCKQGRIKQKKKKSKETGKKGSREAEEQEVEQQKRMTAEKELVEVERRTSIEAGKAGKATKQKSRNPKKYPKPDQK